MASARLGLVIGTAFTISVGSVADAQILDRLERRVERNVRQLQRQVNRADYYTDQAWQSIDPWVREYEVAPLQRAANAVRNTADAVGDDVAGTVDAAEDRLDARFGFDGDNQDQRWFYDYYTYTPTYYYSTDDGDRYASAIRYFDSDNDGVYESQSTYRDSDRDGRYDEYDRVDFYVSEDEGRNETRQDLRDARRHRVDGEVAMTKSARVNGSQHLIVRLKDNDHTPAIDLGPASDLRGRDIEVGASLTATGTLQEVGEKEVLIADSVRIDNGETIEIKRDADLQLTGQVVDVKETRIGSTQHYMAIVEVDGERHLMDLGPTTTFKTAPEASTEIVVHGIPVQARGHRVFLANRVRLNGELFRIDRAKSFTF